MRVVLIAIGIFLSKFALACQPPEYSQKPARLISVAVQVPKLAVLGSTVRAVFNFKVSEPLPKDAKVFLYFSQNEKTYISYVGPARRLHFISVPKDIPSGDYSIEAGVFGERVIWQGQIRITGTPLKVLRKIITRGTFIDKEGVPHRWHINDAHTLIWDGVPWLPVGGMFIYDRDWNLVKAQLDLLEKYGVKDIYLHLGVNQPYLWKDYSDDDYAYFQKTIDYLDDHGFRYGIEFQALESKGYGYQYPGGGPVVEVSDSGRVCSEDRDVKSALFMVEDVATGDMVHYGEASVRENKFMEADVKVPTPGRYRVHFLPNKIDHGFIMYYWGGTYERYRDKVLAHYSKVKLGKGFRFIVDPFWNEMNTRHGIIPDTDDYREGFEKWLSRRYGTIEKLNAAWRPKEGAFPDFASAASVVSMRRISHPSGVLWDWVYDRKNGKLYALDTSKSQFNYDVREYHGRALLEFCNRIADDIAQFADVPVIYKCFSDVDWWHINDTGSAGGHDGLGMESYGTGEPMLLFMGIHAYGELEQATKTTWLVVTETGEGNHQDASPSRNKGIGYTSRLGTMYANFNALLSGGAKGIFQYYMIGGRGVSEPWSDAISRDPRQLEWLATFGRILVNSEQIVEYKPPIYLRLPAHFNQHSMEIYSEPNADFSNYGGWWWREPVGRSQNNIWIVPEVNMKANVPMHIINLEKPPASERFAEEVTQAILDDKRVTIIGFRHDIGTIPVVDKYYTPEFSIDRDGRKFQVLKPTPTSKIIGANEKGEVWNLIDGKVQINSKEVFPLHGYQPQDLVVGSEKAIDPYFGMFDLLGVKLFDGGFSYRDGGEWITVLDIASTSHSFNYFPGTVGGTSARPIEYVILTKPGGKLDARYPDGTPAGEVEGGKLLIRLTPQDTTLVRANLPWAPEGIMVDSLHSRDSVIIRSSFELQASDFKPRKQGTQQAKSDAIIVEGEMPIAHNWNYSRMGGMTKLSRAACLVLETAVPPPAGTGWYASWKFKVEKAGDYEFWIHENLLSISSPCEWRIDDGPWRRVPTTLVPRDITVVTFYNALEDTRQIFAWYHYGNVRLTKGEHALIIRVTEPRGKNMLVTMANDRPYAKMVDCMVFKLSTAEKQNSASAIEDFDPWINQSLIPDASVEFDEDENGKPDFWLKSEDSDELKWTKPDWGNYKIEGLMDINLVMRDSYTGQRALRIDPGRRVRFWKTEKVFAQPGEYELSGYIRSTAPTSTKARLRVAFYDAGGRELGVGRTNEVAHCDWQKVEGYVRAPSGTTYAVVFCAVDPGEEGSVWFDEITLAKREKIASH